MKVESHFAVADALKATRAIVVYENNVTGVATLHDVVVEKGLPMLQAGTLLTREALSTMLRQLSGASQARALLPGNVLCYDAGRLAWWTPSARRPIFFATNKKEWNKEMSGKEVLFPSLLFVADARVLRVFALEDDGKRPDADTKVYRAPFYNLYENGSMCAGNTRLPDTVQPGDIPAWERAFYETNFTHTNLNGNTKLTLHKGGHEGLWRELGPDQPEWKRTYRCDNGFTHEVFPTEYLASLDLTVRGVINR